MSAPASTEHAHLPACADELPDPLLFLDADGSLCSRRFNDSYASRDGARAQARAVYLAGCDLPSAWAGRDRFTVLELGIGLGINCCETVTAWLDDPAATGVLDYVGIEGFPVRPQDWALIREALPGNDLFADLQDRLAARWPAPQRGTRTIWLVPERVRLTLIFDTVQAALTTWQGAADAVYLDGFNPAVNPDMFQEETLALVCRRLRPGARLASYSAAGWLRRQLRALGCEARRRPGFASKWHRLEARWPGSGHDRGADQEAGVADKAGQ